MKELKHLFDNNKSWSEKRLAEDPQYFLSRAGNQNPDYLWIGCSDSRVMANEMLGLPAGELFVHRNIANLVVHTDFNCLSVLQFGVDYLKVKHIIVCGHYKCGGVRAAMERPQVGLADNWLRNIRDVYAMHKKQLDRIADFQQRYNRLVELNVLQQVNNICHTTIVQNAWARGEELHVHGWVYNIEDGLLHDLDCCISGPDQIQGVYTVNPG